MLLNVFYFELLFSFHKFICLGERNPGLADFDAYDGYSTGILKERGNFDASRCY